MQKGKIGNKGRTDGMKQTVRGLQPNDISDYIKCKWTESST